MDQKELSSEVKNTNTEISEMSQHSTNSGASVAEENQSEKSETCNNISSAQKKHDFRETGKYLDLESYVSQHHHSIGTGLYMTDEINDLPPRFKDKVLKAFQNALAEHNIKINRNPLEYFTSFSDDSKAEDKNQDSLVYLSPELLDSERKCKLNEKIFRPSPERESNSKASNSNVASNTIQEKALSQIKSPEPQFSSDPSFKSKTCARSESYNSKNFSDKNYGNSQNFNSRGNSRAQYNVPGNSRFIQKSGPYQSSANMKPSQNIHPKYLPINNPGFNNNSNSLNSVPNIYATLPGDEQNLHIPFYNQFAASLPPQNVLASYDFRDEKTKSSSTSLDSNKRFDQKDTVKCNANTENKPENLIKTFFPHLAPDSNITHSEQIGNSYLIKSTENSFCENAVSHSVLNETSEGKGEILSNKYHTNTTADSKINERKKTFARKGQDKYDRERTFSHDSNTSMNSQTKPSTFNSASFSRHNSDQNSTNSVKKSQFELKRQSSVTPSTNANSEYIENHAKTFYNHPNVSECAKYPAKYILSAFKDSIKKGYANNKDKRHDTKTAAKNVNTEHHSYEKPFDSNPQKASDTSLFKENSHLAGSLSDKNSLVHSRDRKFSDSRSSVVSSHSSKSYNDDPRTNARNENTNHYPSKKSFHSNSQKTSYVSSVKEDHLAGSSPITNSPIHGRDRKFNDSMSSVSSFSSKSFNDNSRTNENTEHHSYEKPFHSNPQKTSDMSFSKETSHLVGSLSDQNSLVHGRDRKFSDSRSSASCSSKSYNNDNRTNAKNENTKYPPSKKSFHSDSKKTFNVSSAKEDPHLAGNLSIKNSPIHSRDRKFSDSRSSVVSSRSSKSCSDDSRINVKNENTKHHSFKKTFHSDSQKTFDVSSVEENPYLVKNLSVWNTPIHEKDKPYNDSRSSVVSSSKSYNDKNISTGNVKRQKNFKSFDSSKDCVNTDCNSADGSLTHNKLTHNQRNKDINFMKNSKVCEYTSNISSDSSSVISDKSKRAYNASDHVSCTYDNSNLTKENCRNCKFHEKSVNRSFDGRGRMKNAQNSRSHHSNQKFSERTSDSYSARENCSSYERDSNKQRNFDKRCNKFNSDKKYRKFSHENHSFERKGCTENGFFVKIEVSENVKDLAYWMRVFKDMFSFKFDLERCCHFSDILILEFDRKEHAIQGLIALNQQKKRIKKSNTPHFLQISTLLQHLTKPCSCKETVINDCVESIENYWESALSAVESKKREIKNYEKHLVKRDNSKLKAPSPESDILKTFGICEANFRKFKVDTLSDVLKAENLKEIQQFKYSFIRECNAFKRCLPIYSKKSEILRGVTFYRVSIVVAETGSGKSTQLAEYLLHSNISKHGLIICTQPRKLAAISVAQFVSGQVGSAIGKVVGYDVGIERKFSDSTKIIYMTDYCLLKQFLKNRDLKGVSCIIIDEAHERSLYTDLILGLLKKCLNTRRDLSVIITSATINPTIFVDYFSVSDMSVPVIEVPGRTYPVETVWLSRDVELGWDYLRACVDKAYEIHVQNQEGDILVFLTSPNESEEAIYLFKRNLTQSNKKPELLCLHGKSDFQEQMQIFHNSGKTSRKIIFTTNVAETAVTIPGIRYVVDSGMTKELMFDPKKNKNYLAVTFITKSAAEQRKGRAGRTQSGICYRMYSKRNYQENMPNNAVPEVLKTNLQKALLKVIELGIDPEKFDFIEAPPKRTISNSIDSLEYLGAIENKKLTDLGKKIAKLPIEPQLSKLVLQGIEAGIGCETIIIASLVSESSKLFIRNEENRDIADERKRKFCHEGGDLCTYLEIYKRWKTINARCRFEWCSDNYVSYKALSAAEKTVKEILFSVRNDLGISVSNKYNDSEFMKQYERVLFDSFSENLCVLSGHPKLGYLSPYLPESFFIHPSSTLAYLGKDSPEFLVYNTLMETTRNFLFDVTPISEATIKFANKKGNFRLPLHSLKSLQVPPKVMGPFGESVLIRHIIGKQGSKIKDLEEKIQQLTNVKDIYVEVEVDKGSITVHISRRFHEKVTNHINQIIEQAHCEMLEDEDVIKLTGASIYFAMSAGGIINDIIMPGEYRELVFNRVPPQDSEELKKYLENYGPLQLVQSSSKRKNEIQICATYKKVCDAQKAFLDLNGKMKYNVSSKPYLPNVSDKTLPLHTLSVSWCSHPCIGCGSVEFSSEEDLIVASGSLTCNSFYVGNKYILFAPSPTSSKELNMTNLPETVEESSIRAKLRECLPDLEVKGIKIKRKHFRITDAAVKEAKLKLSKLLSRYIPSTNLVIEVKDSQGWTWNACVYFDNLQDAEKAFVKLADSTIDSYPLSVKQTFQSSLQCKKEVYNAVLKAVHSVLTDKRKCNEFSVKHVDAKNYVIVEFSCTSMQKLNETRQILRSFLQGETLEFIGKSKYHFLFSNIYTWKIKKIGNLTNTFIILDKLKKSISMYGSSNDCQKAKVEIFSLTYLPDNSYTRTFNLKDSCIPVGFLKNLYTKYGYDLNGLTDEFKLTAVSIDNKVSTLTLTGSKEGIKQAEKSLEDLCEKLFESRGKRQNTSDKEVCPICLDPVSYDFQRLEHCGHAFCHQCLLLQLESKTMPLVCVKENCEKLIFLKDIKRIISSGGGHLKREFCAVALQHHVVCNVGELRYCPTADCQMVYRITKEGSEFNCPGCKNSTCTRCLSHYHYGMSCEMFQKCKDDEDYSLKVWMKENESARKFCPSCKCVIEKADGCNHMECLNCKTHLCWLCLKIFDTGDDVYSHLPYCPKNQ